MLVLSDPTSGESRSKFVDWLELRTITSSRRRVGEADVVGLQELYTGTVDDEDDGDEDGSILQSKRDLLLQSISNEIAYRERILKGHYPFVCPSGGTFLSFEATEAQMTLGQWVYLFCLIASAIRSNRLQLSDVFEKDIAAHFQACACVAAAGYLSGAVSSFGFPRASGEGFLPALKATWARIGEGRVHDNPDVPPGFAADLKDGGIDVVAWRDFPDRMPGKLYLLGQCASGKNWQGKTVTQYVKPLHGNWFSTVPASEAICAMFIPFCLHDEQEEDGARQFQEILQTTFLTQTRHYGIIHDRFRIAYFASHYSDGRTVLPEEVEGLGQMDAVKTWVRAVIAELQKIAD